MWPQRAGSLQGQRTFAGFFTFLSFLEDHEDASGLEESELHQSKHCPCFAGLVRVLKMCPTWLTAGRAILPTFDHLPAAATWSPRFAGTFHLTACEAGIKKKSKATKPCASRRKQRQPICAAEVQRKGHAHGSRALRAHAERGRRRGRQTRTFRGVSARYFLVVVSAPCLHMPAPLVGHSKGDAMTSADPPWNQTVCGPMEASSRRS